MTRTKLVTGRPTTEAGIGTSGSLSTMVPSRYGYRRNMLELVRRIRDYNADASKAISNVLRLANSGWKLDVFRPDGKTPYPEAQILIDELAKNVGVEYGGGLDVLINQLHLTAATQGALAMEIELDEALSIYDFVTVNPWLIDFDRDAAGHWIPGIRKMGSFEPLHPLQFKYVPVDPEPGDPRGRSPFWAALDVVFFQMEVLRDLKAAAHFTGYPRIDISVALEAVLNVVRNSRPDLLQADKSTELVSFLDNYLSDITDMVDDLEPDDAFIHYDAVTSNYIVPSGRTIDIRDLISTIDAQIVSGLKQLPILLGRNEGATTTHATVQWQVYVQELRDFQNVSKRMLEWAFRFSLRVWGLQGIVKFSYDAIRTSDRLADAQAEAIETGTKIQQVAAGWIENDEAAQEIIGHDAVAAPYGLDVLSGSVNTDTQADAGGRAHVHPETRETVADLPTWQQQLYRSAESDFWATYRRQIRAAWQRMDATIQEGGS